MSNKPDSRYGYPVQFTYEGAAYSGYYLNKIKIPKSSKSYYVFASNDPALIALGDFEDTKEVVIQIPNLDDVVFGTAPPIGKAPHKFEFINRYVFVKGQNVEYQIKQAAGVFAPYRTEIELTNKRGTGQAKIKLTCIMTATSEMAKILITNELKRLGIWGITEVEFDWNPYAMINGGGW